MNPEDNRPGSILWVDLTVEPAGKVKDFYASVTGWEPREIPVGDYTDFEMSLPDTGRAVAGICHARGANANLPAQWMLYITVSNLDDSMKEVWAGGGRVISGPKDAGPGERFCVIRDPAGAVATLVERT